MQSFLQGLVSGRLGRGKYSSECKKNTCLYVTKNFHSVHTQGWGGGWGAIGRIGKLNITFKALTTSPPTHRPTGTKTAKVLNFTPTL